MSESNISALSAIGVDQQVAANNMANMNTDGFKASSVEFESGPEGQGVRVADIRQSTTAGPLVNGVEGSNTDVGREMVDMISRADSFSANVAAIRASDEMTGHLLNMIA
ncbi:flagellar basal body rod protein FlgC [Pseudodesulfovibrio sp.]|uniref:flagellar basal body rod protein FlgC n=1 Tax=unclassified Pseudodesulfovibrio TaxID=2661612 RepID=UPI003AFFC82F